MYRQYEYLWVVYHGHQWQLLTAAGWRTDIVEGQDARMIREVR